MNLHGTENGISDGPNLLTERDLTNFCISFFPRTRCSRGTPTFTKANASFFLLLPLNLLKNDLDVQLLVVSTLT